MPINAEDTKKIVAAVDEQLEAYNKTLDEKVKALVDAGKGDSDNDVVALKEDIETIKKTIAANKQQILMIGTGVPGLKDEIDRKKVKFSIGKVVKALYEEKRGIANPWRDAVEEKEIIDANYEFRAKASNFSTSQEAGGVLVPQEITELVGLVYAAIPLLDKLPITKLEGLVGDIRIPRLQTHTTAYQVGENTAPTMTAVKYAEYVI